MRSDDGTRSKQTNGGVSNKTIIVITRAPLIYWLYFYGFGSQRLLDDGVDED